MRRDLPSVRYWREPPERVPQRFYIAFCLLMASIQDSILGEAERITENYNWSATCSYYSMVHAGRLLCFLALGDYPMSHQNLKGVFQPRLARPRSRRPNRAGYPFDWLSDFSEQARAFSDLPLGRSDRQRGSAVQGETNWLSYLAEYMTETGVVDALDRVDRYGAVLVAAGQLRNDSNYEALLIAHEYHHESISSAFSDLARHMSSGSRVAVELAVDAFNGYRYHDPDLPAERSSYEAFLHEYVHDRIGEAIRRKVPANPRLDAQLRGVLARIATKSDYTTYQGLEDNISRAMFGGKSSLMTNFEGRVGNLREKLRSE